MFLQPLGGNTRIYRLFRDPKMVFLICLVLGLSLFIILDSLSTRQHVIFITGGQYNALDTSARTLADLLREQQISLGKLDRLNLRLDALLTDNLRIELYRIQEGLQEVSETLSAGRQFLNCSILPRGKSKLLHSGREGIARKVYHVVRRDDREIRRELLYRRILTPPRPELILKGTGPDSSLAEEDGFRLPVQAGMESTGGPTLFVPPGTLPEFSVVENDQLGRLLVREHPDSTYSVAGIPPERVGTEPVFFRLAE